jgi:hypothetical protein
MKSVSLPRCGATEHLSPASPIGIFTPVAAAIFDLEKARSSSGELGFSLLGSILAAALLVAAGRAFLNDLEDAE